MQPVQPGWVAVPIENNSSGHWFHIVGWTRYEGQPHPVVAGHEKGVFPWFIEFGEDPYIIATLDEWTGAHAVSGGADAVAGIVNEHPGINSGELRRILYQNYGIENQPAAIAEAVVQKLVRIQQVGKARKHYPCNT